MALPDLQKSFDLMTDASNYDLGSVLMQHGHIIAYHKETFNDIFRKYPTYNKEL